jgi:D-arginine dehydrogenase
MEHFDFIVIGGGIAGASAGYELAARARVIVIERESQFGYHTTGRSAALFLQTHGPAVIRALTRGSREFLLGPPAGFSENPLLKPRGCLFIGTAGQSAELDRAAQEYGGEVGGVRRIDGREACAMVPVLRADRIAGAVHDPDAWDIDVHAVHHGFLRGIRARGGRTETGREVTSLVRAGSEWIVTAGGERISAPVVINAAGAWCDVVGAMAGARPIGLVPKRRTVLIFDPPRGADIERWPSVNDIGETFYFKPDAGRILASPEDETPMEPCDVFPDDVDVALAIDRIQRAADLPVVHIQRKWAGLRSFVADGCPVVGFDRDAGGFFWLAGQGGYGIETSSAMGRLAAGLATGRGVPSDLAAGGVTESAVAPARLR